MNPKRSSTNLKELKIIEIQDLANFRHGHAVIFRFSDGSHKYAKFFLPCDTAAIRTSLQQLADEIAEEYG